jgi:hypothetical protein
MKTKRSREESSDATDGSEHQDHDGDSGDDDDGNNPATKNPVKKRRNQTYQVILELADYVKKAGERDNKVIQAALDQAKQEAEIRELKKQLLQEQLLRLRSERQD